MPFLIAGNWKMNGLSHELEEIRMIAQASCTPNAGNSVLVCVPDTLISRAVETAEGHLVIGGEDCAACDAGPYTGDTSAEMLRNAGAGAVIVGHSERRRYHHETDAMVAAKAAAAHRAGLSVIICVGETDAQRDAGEALKVCDSQIAASLPTDRQFTGGSAIAYEPLWAIGSGQMPTNDAIVEMLQHIRQRLKALVGHDERLIRVLYGGSVSPQNAKAILELDAVEGVLVGGASLKAHDFNAILRVADTVALTHGAARSEEQTDKMNLDGTKAKVASKARATDASEFATGWIAGNVEVGPFSWNDPPLYDEPIRQFRRDASSAGFSETDLEHGIGAVPEFIAHAYEQAVSSWRKAHNL